MLLLGKSCWAKEWLFILGALAFALSSFAIALDRSQKKLEDLDQFAYLGPIFAKDKHSLDEFRSLGKIVSEQHKQESNPYDPSQRNEFVELVFDGLLIFGRLDKDKLRLIRVKITGPKWKVLDSLDVGTVAARVEKMKKIYT